MNVSAGSVDTTGAAALDLANTGLGASFTSVSSTNSPAEGIDIDSIGGGSTFTIDDGNAGTSNDARILNATNSGIDIDGSAGTYTFAAVDIDTTGDDGVNLGTNTGTVNINDGTIDDTTGDGVDATSTSFSVDSVEIGQTTAPDGRGVFINAAGTGPFTAALSNLAITATNHAVESNDGGNSAALVANLDNSTLQSTTAVSTVEMTGAGADSTIVTSLDANTVTANGTNGGMLFDRITFDASGSSLSGTQAAATGTTQIGQGTAGAQRVQGDGISFLNPSGDLGFGTLNIFNDSGTGLEVDTKGLGTTFVLGSTGGSIDTNGGPATFLDPLTTALTFGSVTSVGSPTFGVKFDQVAGTVTISALTITNATGDGLFVNGSTGTFTINGGSISGVTGSSVRVGNVGAADTSTLTYDGSITNSAGPSVAIENKTGGAVNLGGTINDTGLGLLVENNSSSTIDFDGATKTLNTGASQAVSLINNTGSTISFSNGGLDIDTSGSANGFNATGGGTVTVTGTGNTVSTTAGTGIAININNTTIGASGMTFLSVNANGAQYGIRLNTTGAGAFTVTGAGTTDGSGGTIQNIGQRGAEFISASNISLSNMTFANANQTDGAASDGTSGGNENTDENGAIHLQSVSNVSLTNVDINGTQQHGINGNLVTNLDITNSVIENTGDEIWESGVYIFQLRGTQAGGEDSVFDNTTIRDSGQFNVFVRNNAATNAPGGAMDRLVFQNCAFADSGNSVAGDHVTISNRNTANFQTVVSSCTFTAVVDQTSDSIQVDAGDTSRSDVQITGSSFVNGNLAINISGSGTAATTFDVSNNPSITSRGSSGVNIASNGSASMSGTVNSNTISSSIANNNGFGIDVVVDATGSAVVSADDNTISGLAVGFRGGARNAGTGTADLTLSNNNITTGGNFAFNAIQLFSGNGSGGESNAVCVNLSSNTTATGFGDDEYFLEQYTGNTFQLQGFAGNGTIAADVEAFVAGTDTGSPTVDAFGGTTVNYTAATCATP
ncbi:MAG: hypothetical protein R2849_07155 [Thermomicrobiales bacterium]